MPQLRLYEKPEFAIRGPFGGIMSEVPIDAIEQLGFADAVNIMFRKGTAAVRPTYESLAQVAAGRPITGVYDFFTSTATRISGAMTKDHLYKWNAGTQAWDIVAGALTGADTDKFTWTTVGQKLCFSQGIDKVKVWDGITPGFADAAVAAVPARYLAEINRHLVVAYPLVGGSYLPQRVFWTGVGDPTDWSSFGYGQTDLFNDLGPITGLTKLYQSGYVTQVWGITQVVPTGNALKPFDWVGMSAHSKGNIFPYSLASFGEDIACYIGKDNVYMFNGTRSDPIGDFPIQGNLRGGALTKIYADLRAAQTMSVHGLITSSINGNAYNAYWIFIPGFSTWVFNFKEGNWTRFVFDKNVVRAGTFNTAGIVRIKDLTGTIADQNWTPANLTNANPLDTFVLGFDDGNVGNFNFTGYSESPYSLSTGQLVMGDYRHKKTTRRIRLALTDTFGQTDFDVVVSNEYGDTRTYPQTFVGTGTSKRRYKIVEPNISGVYLNVTITNMRMFVPGMPLEISEITPLYDTAGEHKDLP